MILNTVHGSTSSPLWHEIRKSRRLLAVFDGVIVLATRWAEFVVNSVTEQHRTASVIQRSIEPPGNPPSPLRHVNHARARLLRQAAPLRAFAIHRRNYSTCPASGSNTTDRIRCANTVRYSTTLGFRPLTGGKYQDSWRTREYGGVVNLYPAPTKRDNDCESSLTQRSSLIRNPSPPQDSVTQS